MLLCHVEISFEDVVSQKSVHIIEQVATQCDQMSLKFTSEADMFKRSLLNIINMNARAHLVYCTAHTSRSPSNKQAVFSSLNNSICVNCENHFINTY